VNLLVDSHVAVWWLDDPKRLSSAARAAIADGRNQVYLSVASVWELGLKVERGKLRLPADYLDRLRADGFGFLDVRLVHARRAPVLAPHHADPFDRILLAQAEIEHLVMVTRDDALRVYGVPVLGA
jgi:PIN domain nuclease of toxin-antitoxin system